jgi:hypothetical protein
MKGGVMISALRTPRRAKLPTLTVATQEWSVERQLVMVSAWLAT